MVYDVISENEPIKAGEIRVEAYFLEKVVVCRYSKNLDINSRKVIGRFNLLSYCWSGKNQFLHDIEKCIVRAHCKPQYVRITTYVMDFFAYNENY